MVAGFLNFKEVIMKIAILMDGSFFQKKFYYIHKRNPSANDVVNVANSTLNDSLFADDKLFRIYYYDCYPYDEKIRHPLTGNVIDFSQTPVYKARYNFLRNLALMPNIALRSGKLIFGGWAMSNKSITELRKGQPFSKDMLKPKIDQKEVDIKIGLDIAWISSKQIVDKIILYTGDSDFVPAMKLARKEGLMVYLVHLGHKVRPSLREHCDGIIKVSLQIDNS